MASSEEHADCIVLWPEWAPRTIKSKYKDNNTRVYRYAEIYLCLNAHDIGSVAQLCHAKTPGQVQGVDARQECPVVLLCPQLGNGPATQGEVDTGLDAETVVHQIQHLQTSPEALGICRRTTHGSTSG
jgi:hypothetical protein